MFKSLKSYKWVIYFEARFVYIWYSHVLKNVNVNPYIDAVINYKDLSFRDYLF